MKRLHSKTNKIVVYHFLFYVLPMLLALADKLKCSNISNYYCYYCCCYNENWPYQDYAKLPQQEALLLNTFRLLLFTLEKCSRWLKCTVVQLSVSESQSIDMKPCARGNRAGQWTHIITCKLGLKHAANCDQEKTTSNPSLY